MKINGMKTLIKIKSLTGMILLLALWFTLTGMKQAGEGVRVLHVRDFGATPASDNVYDALKSAVAAALETGGPTEIRFEKDAVYRISPTKDPGMSKYALFITGADHLVINGQGSTLLITHPEVGGICTEHSTNVEIRDICIDYDPLPYALGTITQVNIPEYWFELKVAPGFMEPDQPSFDRAMSKWGLTIRNEKDGGRRYGPTAIFASGWEKTGERIWRFHVIKEGKGYVDPLVSSGLKPGESYIHMARNYAMAVAARKCDHLLWENITVYASPGLAFYPHITSHHTIRNCHVKVKEGRIFSTNADGIHMRGSRGHVLIDGCSFQGMADDGINVHSSALSISGQPSLEKILVKKHTYSVTPGDELVLVYSETAEMGPRMKVKEVQDKGANWLLTLDRELPPLATGEGFESSDNLYNLSEAADPFVIRNCHFGDYRGRGILVSAHGGLIENNVFDLREGWSVIFNYESTRWAEGPIAHDVTVRNNTFYGNGSFPPAILSVLYARQQGSDRMTTSSGRPLYNLHIEGNRFLDYGRPVIELSNAREVEIRDSRVQCSENVLRPHDRYASVMLKNCEDVEIDSLWVRDFDKRHYAAVDIDTDCSPGNTISIKNVQLDVHPSCQEIMDHRLHSRFYNDPSKLAAYEFFTRGMGKGKAVILAPENVKVNEIIPEVVLSYVSDEEIAAGGSVRLWCPNGATNPQLTHPSDPGYMHIETNNIKVEVKLDQLSFQKMYKQKHPDGFRFVMVEFPKGLPPGEKLHFHWKNVKVDTRAGRWEGDRWLFHVAVDHNADGNAELIKNPPEIPKLPDDVEYLLARIASSSVSGEPVRLNISAFDKYNNPAILYESGLSLTCEREGVQIPPGIKITPEDLGSVQCDLVFRDTGFYWLRVRSDDGLVAESNPVEVFQTDPGRKLYWGDLHVHTQMSADARTGAHTVSSYEGSYQIGRSYYALDFQANTDHHGLDQGNYGPAEWETMQQITNEANEDGSFVTLVACELSGPKGDQNVYFAAKQAPFLSHNPGDSYSREKAWAELHDTECFFVPHHICQGMRPWDWTQFEPERIPVCEIFSNHGRCEYAGNEPHYAWHKEPSIKGRTWVEQLNSGKKLGAIASSDDHWARPGNCGLTGVWTTDLTRPSIYSALKNRQCYASTGARVILHFSLEGKEMGQEVKCSKAPILKVRAAAPGLIEKLEIISEGKSVYSMKPQSKKVETSWQSPELKDTFYYLRLTLAPAKNTESCMRNRQQFVWSSPIFVEAITKQSMR